MQSRPPDLSDATLAAAISQGWGIGPTTVTYQPVGYGSHHWSAEDGRGGRWFTSVDVLEQADPEASLHRLRAALVVAVTARAAGLAYVVAPVPATDGSVLRRLPGGYALAVYPHVDGKPGGFGDGLAPAESTELTGMLDALEAHWHSHGATDRLTTERFRAAVAVVGEGVTSSPVTFSRTGATIEAAGATPILDAAESAGLLMPSGCRMGICFGCVLPLREGAVRDLRTGEITTVTAHESDSGGVPIQTCISAAAGPCHIDH